jgi:hypothetical protein
MIWPTYVIYIYDIGKQRGANVEYILLACLKYDLVNSADIDNFCSLLFTMSVFRQAVAFLTLGSQVYAFSLQSTYDSSNFFTKFNFRDVSAHCI